MIALNTKVEEQARQEEELANLDDTRKVYRGYTQKELCGKKIKSVRYMTPSEAESSGWYYQPILLILDDGTALCPMSDDEGNEASALCVLNNEELSTIPVMRERI